MLSAQTAAREQLACAPDNPNSPYINVDSWIYPAVLRLHSMGYLDWLYIGQRPWTRANVAAMIDEVGEQIATYRGPSEAQEEEALLTLAALASELKYSRTAHCFMYSHRVKLESVYTLQRAITGVSLRDSFHLGSSSINDYGRPFQPGYNSYTGLSAYATTGQYIVYLRGELQHAPAGYGYSPELAEALSTYSDNIRFADPATGIPYCQQTIPMGASATYTKPHLLEGYIGTTILNHFITFGKQDEWLSPAQGGAMALSNNADNLYALHINRLEPLVVPGLSHITGPFRYEFLIGPLRGHTYIPASTVNVSPPSFANPTGWVNPGAPWMHVEKVSFKPFNDLELGFERTIIWGGQGHEGITLHSFLRGFFSLTATDNNTKNSDRDPGARFCAFNFSYRIPGLRNWLTLYSDAEAHDDVSPIDNPRHSSWRPGIYLSHLPAFPKLDLRLEAVNTDPRVNDRSMRGQFMYWEAIQRQGYTNQGQLMGDWAGREDKGGQAWLTYHLSPNEMLQFAYRNQKADKDFFATSSKPYGGGTTLNDWSAHMVKRLRSDLELSATFTYEHWKAPIYLSGPHNVTITNIQLTWRPRGNS